MKLEDINIRDPFVLPYDGKYYMYGTRVKGMWEKSDVPYGFDVYESSDLSHWSGPISVFERPESFWGTHSFWAPEVHIYKDKFYMFASFKSEIDRRGTAILVSDNPKGPFKEHSEGAVTPHNWECLDGTFYLEGSVPYIVFCHEWVQVKDGTICALRLTDDLKESIGEPIELWHAGDASWRYDIKGNGCYVTDGPFFVNIGKEIVCIWSSFKDGKYVEAVSRSDNGKIDGKWSIDDNLLFEEDGGHGMIFKDYDNHLYFTYHSPNESPKERPIIKLIDENMLMNKNKQGKMIFMENRKRQVYNPYLPLNEYIPDGEPHVFGDRVYIYGSHDKENGDFFCMLDYVTYSAPIDDLTNWRYEGVIYKASRDPLSKTFRYMYAPDVVRGNDGKYYLFYSLADQYPGCSFIMSVAVCDTPCGEFKFHGHVRKRDGKPLQDYLIFDPGVINDNGTIRLYYGMWYDFDENPKYTHEESIKKQMEMYNKTREEIESTPGGVQGPVMVELEDDMLTIKDDPKRIFPVKYKGTPFENHEFFEASSMRKVGNKYYFIYSSFNNHELCYATSSYPDKDFTFGGVIISNGDIGYKGRKPEDRLTRTGNNHGSIECINGQWYIFYHRQTRKTEFSRQGCAEKIEILKDGSIPQVEITSCGLNGGPLEAKGMYPSIICCNLTNGHMPHCWCPEYRLPNIKSKGDDRFIGEIEQNTMIGYKYFDFENVSEIGVVYRTDDIKPDGKFLISLKEEGESIGEIPIDDTKDWTRSSCIFSKPIIGNYPLYLTYEGEGAVEVKDIFFN